MEAEHRHIYFYAKGHYKRTDCMDDLRKILSQWSGVALEYYSDDMIYHVVTNMAYLHVTKNPQRFVTFLQKVHDNLLALIGEENNKENYTKHMIKATVQSILSMLLVLNVKEINGELGDPDYTILPSRL